MVVKVVPGRIPRLKLRRILSLFSLAAVATMSPASLPDTRTAADAVVTFNEVMFAPIAAPATSTWIELHNQMGVDLELSGWQLEGAVAFEFPAGTLLPAQGYVVVAANPATLLANWGATNVLGSFTGQLAPTGGVVRLRNHNRRLLDELRWTGAAPWPVAAAGSGASLAKRDRFAASSPAGNWRASLQIGGTPSRQNFRESDAADPPTESLLSSGSRSRWKVPEADSPGNTWTLPGFDDSGWDTGDTALGFDTTVVPSTTQINVALGQPVIDGSGAWNNNPFNVPEGAYDFTAQNVSDGSSTDVFGVNYWLGREGRLGEYFTLDLGRSFRVEEIRLRNTHNDGYNDRGTAAFELYAATAVDAENALVDPQRILAGTLSHVGGAGEIPADIFTAANGLVVTQARYLRFVALTANNPGNHVGLNEIEVLARTAPRVARAYTFDHTLDDSSGQEVNGIDAGAHYAADVPPALGQGVSLAFDGIGDQVQVPDAWSPPAYTIALWVSADAVRPCSLVVRTDPTGPHSSYSHQLLINASGRFEHYTFDGAPRAVTGTTVVQPGTWYHVTGTAVGNGPLRIFVNGVLEGETTTQGPLWTAGDQWRLGASAGQAPNYLQGRLDELALWHMALDPADIARLASGTRPLALFGYHGLFGTDLQDALFPNRSAVWLRLPFQVPSSQAFDHLTLLVNYDDGFIAWLNGTEILRRNAPATAHWDSTALTNRSPADAVRRERVDLSAFAPLVGPGPNVLAIQALNAAADDPDFLFSADLLGQPSAGAADEPAPAFSEIDAGGSPGFFVELVNPGPSVVPLTGHRLVSSRGTQLDLGAASLAPGAYLAIQPAALGVPVLTGDRLFLLGPGSRVLDGVTVQDRLQGRLPDAPDGPWWYPSVPTPGASNRFEIHHEIVINEILYHHPATYGDPPSPAAYAPVPEQWIELYNRSDQPVDLSGWRLEGGIQFAFPPGRVLAPNAYLVVANHAAVVRSKYPGIEVDGDFSGRLSHRGDRLILLDAQLNPACEVAYYDDAPWPAAADGGGSSLELRDPRADPLRPASWAASDASARSGWQHYEYVARAIAPVYSPGIFSFHELRLGLLDAGEALVDNVSVVDLSETGPPRELVQNPGFEAGAAHWRRLGNHSHSAVKVDPANPTRSVLHLIATGPTSYLDNRVETTLKTGDLLVPVVTGHEYRIAFDAQWLTGSPQLRTELYYNKVAATTILHRPNRGGTPGRRNTAWMANAGPGLSTLAHRPVIPGPTDPITIAVDALDPDGLASVLLWYAADGGTWRNTPMTPVDSRRYAATLPPQPLGTVLQFYVEATDRLGASATEPAAGPASRALIRIDSRREVAGKQTLRTILTPGDATALHDFPNLMSDDPLGCTVVHAEREVFYDARLRLHGSMFSRPAAAHTGLNITFPADHLYRGSRASVIVRRGDVVQAFVRHILNQAGGLPAVYNDVVHLVSHRADNVGAANLTLANYDDTFVDSQFEGRAEGTVFKLEGIREYLVTDDGTPEGRKLPQPVGWIQSYDIADCGEDPEQYRWGIMILNQRARDDYSRVVAMGRAFSLSGSALQAAVPAVIDVDQWARYFALQTLVGVGDIYAVENPHNIAFYARSDDGRMVVLQNDWGYAFAQPTGGSIDGINNVFDILRLPVYRRVYQGHLLDLINSTWRGSYLAPWADHYTRVLGQDYGFVPGYADARAAAVRSQLAPQIPFVITSNGGTNFTVNTPTALLEGRGWIDVHDIRRPGATNPLPVTWLDDQRWQLVVSLQPGANAVSLAAYDVRGNLVGQTGITIATTATALPFADLRITELLYHPLSPTLHEIEAGFDEDEAFEFLELANTGTTDLPLTGVRFTAGINFTFGANSVTHLAPGQRLLLVADRAAFAFRYGTQLPIAGVYSGALNNAGERIQLEDAWGHVIQAFSYDDAGAWPAAADGAGYSLEVLDPQGNYSDPANWQSSPFVGGSPGQPTVVPPGPVAVDLSTGQVRLRFRAIAGQSYSVLKADSLPATTWTSVGVVPATSVTRIIDVFDVTPLEAAQRYYRISTP